MFNCNVTKPQEAYHSKESGLVTSQMSELKNYMYACCHVNFKLNMNLFELAKITLRMMTVLFFKFYHLELYEIRFSRE